MLRVLPRDAAARWPPLCLDACTTPLLPPPSILATPAAWPGLAVIEADGPFLPPSVPTAESRGRATRGRGALVGPPAPPPEGRPLPLLCGADPVLAGVVVAGAWIRRPDTVSAGLLGACVGECLHVPPTPDQGLGPPLPSRRVVVGLVAVTPTLPTALPSGR